MIGNIESLLRKMPTTLAGHLKRLMKANGFDKDEEKKKIFLNSWLEKRALFDKIVEHNGLALIEEISYPSLSGFLVLTYSGSLAAVSPIQNDKKGRDLTYNGIGARTDTIEKRTFQNVTIELPVSLHKPLKTKSEQIPNTSPVIAIAVEANEANEEKHGKMRIIGERISRSLIAVNRAFFSKHTETALLGKRYDLFRSWCLLSWFEYSGLEEEVFVTRAWLLYQELFSRYYHYLSENIVDSQKRDERFNKFANTHFPAFTKDYCNIDINSSNNSAKEMLKLEKIPSEDAWGKFVSDYQK